MRFLAVFALVSMFCASASAQDAAPPPELSAVYGCASVTADSDRLACYDAAVGRLREAQNQGQVMAVDRQQVATLERESFGFSLPSIGAMLRSNQAQPDPLLDRVELQVARVTTLSDGRHSFVMTNGQVWSQVEAVSASNVRSGDTVSIRRAALGSYMLSPEHGRAHRVRRSE